jgi:CheY-like chemotaxis protein
MFPLDTVILLIDDSDTVILSVKEELQKMGYSRITIAKDGREALGKLNMADQINSPVGLIISDWVMPVMTGIELLRLVRINKDWKDIPFILLTSQNDMNQVTEAVFAGVSNYIVKPLVKGVLKEKLEAAYKKIPPKK